MKSSLRKDQEKELMGLKRRNGLLVPEDVVEFARNPKTALHTAFPWDDKAAAHQHRLNIARDLIVSVRIVHTNYPKPVQAFVSLRKDRRREGGGYRELVTVMTKKELRQQLLTEALRDLEYWQRKYEQLRELAPVLAAIERLRKKSAR